MTDTGTDNRMRAPTAEAGPRAGSAASSTAKKAKVRATSAPRPARPARPARPRRPAADPHAQRAIDPVDQYLRSLGSPRVLSKEETEVLARSMQAARDEFLAELNAIPGTARRLVERWLERRERGHVTAALSAHYRDGSGRDHGTHIDRALARIEKHLERHEVLATRTSRAAQQERAKLEVDLARLVGRAEFDFEVLHEIFKEMRALSNSKERSDRPERKRLGLGEAVHRAHVVRAEEALMRMEEVKQTFVFHNLRLVIKQAKRFRKMGVPYADLIQEGNLGLIRAVEKFDHTLGYRFSTYAVWWIEQALVRAVQNASRTVRVPTHVYDLEVRARKVRAQLHSKLGRAAKPEEVAAVLGVATEEIIRARTSMQPIASTHAVLPGTEEFTMEDTLAYEDGVDPVTAIDEGQIGRMLGERMEQLDERERWVVEAHYGLSGDDPMTLQEIGNRMGLSRERVRQIEARALSRLREEGGLDALHASLDLG